MHVLLYLYPGDGWAAMTAVVLCAASALLLVGIVIAWSLPRYPAARHSVLLSALVSAMACPFFAIGYALSGTSVATIHLMSSETSPSLTGGTAGAEAQPVDVAFPVVDVPMSPPASESAAAPLESSGRSSVAQDRIGLPGVASQSQADRIDIIRTAIAAMMLVWWCGVTLLFAFLALSWRRVHNLLRTARTSPAESLQAVHGEIRRALGVETLPTVLSSDLLRSPIATGVGRPVIILPTALLAAIPKDELRDVLIHETAHILRRDPLVNLVQAIARIAFWPIPFVHILNWELDRARDEVCDNFVLGSRDPISYGRTLLQIGEFAQRVRSRFASVGILNRRGSLESRVANLLDKRRNRTTRVPLASAATLLGTFTAVGAFISGTTIVAQQQEPLKKTATTLDNSLVAADWQGVSSSHSTNVPPKEGVAAGGADSQVATPDSDDALSIPWVNEEDGAATASLQDLGVTLRKDEGGRTQVSFLKPPTAQSVEFLKRLHATTEVVLSRSGATGDQLAFLKHLPTVESLTLNDTQLTAEGLDHVKKLGNLKSVSLHADGADYQTLGVLQALPNLDAIHLRDSQITNDDLRQLGTLTKIQSLSINNLTWERAHPDKPLVTDEGLAHLSTLLNLKSLLLSFGTRVSDEGLEHLTKLRQLETLSLRSDLISDSGFAHVGQLPRLKSLVISVREFYGPPTPSRMRRPGRAETRLTDTGLSHLRSLVALENLELDGGRFTDSGMAHLSGLIRLKALSLNTVTISDKGLERLAGLSEVERLSFIGKQFVTDEGLKHFGRMPKLKWLPLRGASITDDGLASIQDMSNLISLKLDRTEVSDAGLAHLKGLSGLRFLGLSNTRISGEGLRHIAGLTKLTSLDLSETQVTDDALRHLSSLKHLHSLQLHRTAVSDAGLAHVQGLTELTSLWLKDTRVGDEGLQHLSEMSNLWMLLLGGSQVTDKGMQHLSGLTALRSLNLDDTSITGTGLRHLRELDGLTNLSLEGCVDVSDDGLVCLKGMRKLESLELSGTGIRGDGIVHLKDLPSLRWLNLRSTKIADAGLEHVGKIKNLERLYLDMSKITDAGLRHLKELTGLSVLGLRGTLVTNDGVAQLKATLTKTDIAY